MDSVIARPMWERRKALYVYYRRTGFYKFLFKNLLNALLLIVAFVGVVMLLKQFVPDDFSDRLSFISDNPVLLMSVFFVSESLLGLIPPDFFIIWIQEYKSFWLLLGLLSVLSYAGGMISYGIGYSLRKNTFFREKVQQKLAKYTPYMNKWGGVFIVIAAVTPLPFSPVSLLGGTMNYPLKKYALYASTRVLRFIVYGFIFFKLTWI